MKMFKEGLTVKIEAAEAASRELEEFIMGKVSLSSSLAQDMGRLLDSGIESPEALHWSRLVYLVEIRKFHLVSTKNTSLDITFVS